MVIHWNYISVIPRKEVEQISMIAGRYGVYFRECLIEMYELDEDLILEFGKFIEIGRLCRKQKMSFDLYMQISIRQEIREWPVAHVNSGINPSYFHHEYQKYVPQGRKQW